MFFLEILFINFLNIFVVVFFKIFGFIIENDVLLIVNIIIRIIDILNLDKYVISFCIVFLKLFVFCFVFIDFFIGFFFILFIS